MGPSTPGPAEKERQSEGQANPVLVRQAIPPALENRHGSLSGEGEHFDAKPSFGNMFSLPQPGSFCGKWKAVRFIIYIELTVDQVSHRQRA